MKTVLPTKIKPPKITTSGTSGQGIHEYDGYLTIEAQTLNQLIDVVAELKEVVEGKPKFDVEKWYRGEPQTKPTPSLKEQLLEQVRLMQYTPWDDRNDREGEIKVVSLADVEDIIRELMP